MSNAENRSKAKPLPSQELLIELLDYDTSTGKLFWKKRDIRHFSDGHHSAKHSMNNWNSKFAWKEALTSINGSGYKNGRIFYTNYAAHRVIFKILHNEEPPQIDHANQIKIDNRGENLVSSCHAENQKNYPIRSDNTSGFTGVSWDKECERWKAMINVNGKRNNLGRFTNLEDAIKARQAANLEHGFHENHGKKKEGSRNNV